jgi:hypothetical protein
MSPMRTASALFMFGLSIAAGYVTFGLYRHLATPPPGAPPVQMTEHLVMIGDHAFTPFQVYSTLIAIAVVTGVGGIVVLVAGHDKPGKS